jgi:hypothetical protein
MEGVRGPGLLSSAGSGVLRVREPPSAERRGRRSVGVLTCLLCSVLLLWNFFPPCLCVEEYSRSFPFFVIACLCPCLCWYLSVILLGSFFLFLNRCSMPRRAPTLAKYAALCAALFGVSVLTSQLQLRLENCTHEATHVGGRKNAPFFFFIHVPHFHTSMVKHTLLAIHSIDLNATSRI